MPVQNCDGCPVAAAAHGVWRARVDRAVAVDVPAVQHRLGDRVAPHLAGLRQVITEVEVDGVTAVGHVLRQVRVDKLKQRGLAGVVVNDGPGEGVVEVPLEPPDTPVQLHLERVVVVGVAVGKVDDVADAGVAGHGADQVGGIEAGVGRVGGRVDELRLAGSRPGSGWRSPRASRW